ncbi:MAG TPA: S28 family serine protease [Solirubrobacteraceae bacterium]|nr:S28 family serine protease [Solirubrobacteraceae bacterium]
MLVGALVAVGLMAGPAQAQEQDILERLRAVPGVTSVREDAAPTGYRFFNLTFHQPADHRRPSSGSFEQRITILHKSTDRPMVLYTGGYNVRTTASRSEPTQLVDGNQLSVEQRFFTPSRPQGADWSDLNIWQAATDHHRLIEALKPIYGGNWISTGGSKGGMASVYHRRFYPHDVDGTVAYVAPSDPVNFEDSAYTRFFDTVGDEACRDALVALQREALGRRRAELLARWKAAAAAADLTFSHTVGTADRSLELSVLDTPWAFWQYLSEADCPSVPAASASTDEIYGFIDSVVSFAFYTDQGLEPYIPYYFQAGTQLGWPEPSFRHLRGLTRYPGLYEPRAVVPRELPMRFEPLRMLDVNLWVRLQGSELLFVYGENDPWGAEPFRISTWTRDSYWYEVENGNHGSNISRLAPSDKLAATETVQRWAGAETATRSARRYIPGLDDYNPGLDRGLPF